MSWSSEVAVCNGALSLLGAEPIFSLDASADSSVQAAYCSSFFTHARDVTMRAYPWNFAVKRKDLGAPLSSSDANAPLYEWSNAFLLPRAQNDFCLRVLETEGRVPHRVEGIYLLTNQGSVRIKYIRRITAPELWDESYKDALSARLAMMLAMPITKSEKMLAAMSSLYSSMIGEAYSVDTQEGTPEEIDSDEILYARYSSGGWR